jgi:flavin reductase (DIM6/NTAB) family NADH-FMN oxidoreductase RutF
MTVLGLDGLPHGITANSFTSVSLDPPLILVCVDHRSQVIGHVHPDSSFGVNVLAEEQQDLSCRFAKSYPDRFTSIEWYSGRTGVPLFPGALATLECCLVDKTSAGDHFILIGQVLHVTYREGDPLTYFKSSYRSLVRECAAGSGV